MADPQNTVATLRKIGQDLVKTLDDLARAEEARVKAEKARVAAEEARGEAHVEESRRLQRRITELELLVHGHQTTGVDDEEANEQASDEESEEEYLEVYEPRGKRAKTQEEADYGVLERMFVFTMNPNGEKTLKPASESPAQLQGELKLTVDKLWQAPNGGQDWETRFMASNSKSCALSWSIKKRWPNPRLEAELGACKICTNTHRACLKLRDGKLVVMPLTAVLRQGVGEESVRYWVRGTETDQPRWVTKDLFGDKKSDFVRLRARGRGGRLAAEAN